MNITTKELGKIIEPALLSRAGAQHLPVLSMTMHHGLVDQQDKFKKRVASLDASEYKIVKKGQLVVGFPIDEGVLAFQELYEMAIVSPAYEIWNVINPSSTYSKYLERYLQSPWALAYFSSKLQSTTARRRTLPRDLFLRLPVPFPAYGEQRRLASLLELADLQRSRRRHASKLLDNAAESVFNDMFGDPVNNDRDWQPVTVGDFVRRFESGKSLATVTNGSDSVYRILKISAVTSGVFNAFESKPVSPGYIPPKSHIVRDGDLLFSRANTSELVGATAPVKNPPSGLLLPDKLWRFTWRSPIQVDPLFVHYLFRQPLLRRQISQNATGSSSSMKNISQAKVLGISCSLPPLNLQQAFVNKVLHVEKIKRSHLEHLAELDGLFASLQHRVFSGELWDNQHI